MTSELSGVHSKSFLGARTRSNKSESSGMEDLNWFRQLFSLVSALSADVLDTGKQLKN
jgi:hypothetical protein